MPSEKRICKHSSRETWSHPRNNSLFFHGREQSWNVAFQHGKATPLRNFNIYKMRVCLIIVMASLAFFPSWWSIKWWCTLKLMMPLFGWNMAIHISSAKEKGIDFKLNASMWKLREKLNFLSAVAPFGFFQEQTALLKAWIAICRSLYRYMYTTSHLLNLRHIKHI